MWVFDGSDWIEEGVSTRPNEASKMTETNHAFDPQLQIQEVFPSPEPATFVDWALWLPPLRTKP